MIRKALLLLGIGVAIAMLAHAAMRINQSEFQVNAVNAADSVSAQTGQSNQKPDIEWFKDRMKISEKYAEPREGVLGMSWTHFFTMVLLFLFALGALVVFVQRQRRTREILERIRKEMTNGNSG